VSKPINQPNNGSINLTLSRKEYGDLIKLVYAGEWIINAIRTPDEKIEQFSHIEQAVYKVGIENGFNYLLEASEEYGVIFPTRKLEESEIANYISEYDEQNMREELIDTLAMRDFQRQYSAVEIRTMTREDRIEKQSIHLDKYREEFEVNGVDRLEISR